MTADRILGIETSCDETAAAVVRQGTDVMSSVVSSQIEIHQRYGGVVPEVASRAHVESIMPVIAQSIVEAGIDDHEIDAPRQQHVTVVGSLAGLVHVSDVGAVER